MVDGIKEIRWRDVCNSMSAEELRAADTHEKRVEAVSMLVERWAAKHYDTPVHVVNDDSIVAGIEAQRSRMNLD